MPLGAGGVAELENPLQAPKPQLARSKAAPRTAAASLIRTCWRNQNHCARTAIAQTSSSKSHGGIAPKGSRAVRAVVETVTAKLAPWTPSSVTERGETVHFAVVGAPLQLRLTVP